MKKHFSFVLIFFCLTSFIFAEEKLNQGGEDKTSVEITLSVGWNLGSYKETTFSLISEALSCPRFSLGTKIFSGDFIHIITADYFITRPSSALTDNANVYKTYDPVTGEYYWQASVSSLSFQKIRLQYDLGYKVYSDSRMDIYAGGNFACNVFMQFEHYPSITGLLSIGPSASMNFNIDERNSFFVMCGLPLLGYGVRPPYAGCDARLMKYAEENFLKIFTLGDFLSIHNYQSVYIDFEYKLKANNNLSFGLGCDFEYSRIAVPDERPLYYVDGNIKAFASYVF